jgi:branched-chain amino acid aminotransferase
VSGKVYLQGNIVEPQDAKISIFDRGFLYGDSVFETLRAYKGKPFAQDEHLTRLFGSGERVGFELPWSRENIAAAIEKTLHASGLHDAYVRVIATRGAGLLGLDPGLATDPQLIVLVLPLPNLPAYDKGLRVRLVSVQRTSKRAVDPQAKTGNYLNSVLAMREAKEQGADEAIMLDRDGRVAEASAANVFAWVDDGWKTPPLDVGILSGITRQVILRLCKEQHIPVEEKVLWPQDLQRATEIFLCASVREIVPVVILDGASVGSGKPGEKTQQLRMLYQQLLAAQ